MAITIQDYQPVVDNTVYARKVSGDKPGIALVFLSRHTKPTEDEILTYIQDTAKKISGAAALIVVGHAARQNRTPLEGILLKLPQPVLGHVAMGRPDCTQFLREHIGDGARRQTPQQYVTIGYGTLPESGFIPGQNEAHYFGELARETKKGQGYGRAWDVELLIENGLLPAYDDVQLMLKHQTTRSRTLVVTPDQYDVSQVSDAFKVVHAGLVTPETLSHLPDASEEIREIFALGPVVALHNYIVQSMLEQQQAPARPFRPR